MKKEKNGKIELELNFEGGKTRVFSFKSTEERKAFLWGIQAMAKYTCHTVDPNE